MKKKISCQGCFGSGCMWEVDPRDPCVDCDGIGYEEVDVPEQVQTYEPSRD
jgi:DnaJ-class molecular chaperone